MPSDSAAAALNRANWDLRATVHGQDAYYDLAGLVAGADTLTDVEDAALALAGRPDVRGCDVLHVQCHLGFDAVSLARRGARVTGVDFSPVAIRRAGEIAERCGVTVQYLEADATALPHDLHGRFDLAYATIGVLCWIGDIAAWMRSVAACLRPGGALVLVDGHPLAGAVADREPDPDGTDPDGTDLDGTEPDGTELDGSSGDGTGGLRLDFPYAYDGPHEFVVQGSYADRDAPISGTTVQYAHSLGEIVTAAVAAGLRVTGLVEHLDAPIDLRGAGTDPDGRFRLRVDGVCLPVLFTLTAGRL
ncbi:MAG: class I SAM-dependent methyltransferase [Actinocatenispora sp.]